MKIKHLLTLSACQILPFFFVHHGFADPGDVTVINTISPKNSAFQYVVRSTNVFVSTASFTGNLGTADANLQHAMQTIDQLSVGGGGGSSSLAVRNNGVLISSPTSNLNFLNPITATLVSGSTAQISISTSAFPAGATNYIQNTNSLQNNSTFYVTSGTVLGPLIVVGNSFNTGNLYLHNFASLAYGTDSPLYQLHFVGGANDGTPLAYFTHSNGTALQTLVTGGNSAGAIFSNSDTGTDAYGMNVQQNGGNAAAGFFQVTTSTAVYGTASGSGIGVEGITSSGTGVYAKATAGGDPLNVQGSSTVINGLRYIWPSSQSANFLKNDGSGNLSWAAAGGGSVSASTVAYGMLYTTGTSPSNNNISTTPVKMTGWMSLGVSSNTTLSTTSAQITISITGAYMVNSFFTLVQSSLSVSGQYFTFWIAVNGSTQAINHQNIGNSGNNLIEEPVSFGGVLNLNQNDVVSIYVAASTTTSQPFNIEAGQLTVAAVGGSSGGGSSNGVTGSTGSIVMVFDNSSIVGSTRCTTIPYACTVSSWSVVSDSGTLTMHVSSSTAGNYPTVSSMSGSTPPSLTAQYRNAGTTSGWTQTTLSAGDVVCSVLDSLSGLTWANLVLWIVR